MSIIKEFFYGKNNSDKPETKKTTPTAKPPQSLSASENDTDTDNLSVGTASTIETGTDYDAILDKVLEDANKPGADFFEFSTAINNMKNALIADDVKYENVNATFSALGVTPEQLVADGEYYIGKLDEDAARFEKGWKKAEKEQITDKKALMESIASENIELNKKIQLNNEEAQKLNGEVFASTTSLNNEKMAYENKLNNKKSMLNDKISKIKTYLYGKSAK